MSSNTTLPFEQNQLLKLNNNVSLLCEKLLHYIPNKCWICLGHWDDQQVIVKLFTSSHQAQRELNNIHALTQTNLKTTNTLYDGWATKKSLYVILQTYISPTDDFMTHWYATDKVTRISLLERLILIIAQLHEAGIRYFNLKNFVLHKSEIYILSSVNALQTTNHQSLNARASLKNLGLLLALFPTSSESLYESLYLSYTKARNKIFTLTNFTRLKKWVTYFRKKNLFQLGKAIFHSNTQLTRYKNWHRLLICYKEYDTEALHDLFNNPDVLLQADATKILKTDATSTIGKVIVDGKTFTIKRHNLKSCWHQIKRALSTSRAAKNWRNVHYLDAINVNTLKPVAMLEKRFGPFRRESYFISEYVEADHLEKFFADSPSKQKIEMVAKNIKELFSKLATAHIAHGDTKGTNFLVVDNEPLLLDLDALRMYRFYRRWQRAAKRDWNRFLENWQNQPEILEQFRTMQN